MYPTESPTTLKCCLHGIFCISCN